MGVTEPGVTPPEPLGDHHVLDDFTCGDESLDNWLKNRTREGQQRGSARTFVVCQENRVVGYYSLAAGAVVRADAPGKLRRNMPDPIPVFVLGRMAVDLDFQGSGLGSALLKDAMIRTLTAANSIGAAALLVHALNDELRHYYQRFGFLEFPETSLTFFLPLTTIAQALTP